MVSCCPFELLLTPQLLLGFDHSAVSVRDADPSPCVLQALQPFAPLLTLLLTALEQSTGNHAGLPFAPPAESDAAHPVAFAAEQRTVLAALLGVGVDALEQLGGVNVTAAAMAAAHVAPITGAPPVRDRLLERFELMRACSKVALQFRSSWCALTMRTAYSCPADVAHIQLKCRCSAMCSSADI